MKKIIFLLCILLTILFINIPIDAKEEMDSSYGINKCIDSSTTTFMLIENIDFNYVYSRIDKLSKLSDYIYDLPNDIIIPEIDLIIKYDLGNDTYLIYEYGIRDKHGAYLNIYVMDNLFIKIVGNDSTLNSVIYQDLREYGNKFKFDKDKYILEYKSTINIDDSNLNVIFNRLIDKIGFNYLEGLLVNEKKIGNTFYVNEGPHIMDVICFGDISDTHIEECIMDGEAYNYDKPVGTYHFFVYHLKYSGVIDVLDVHICIADNKSLYCDEIDVSYIKYLTLRKYKNNYIHGPDYYIDKNKYIVDCDYFYGSDKMVGKHIVNVRYKFDDFETCGSGIINVIDDVNPYFVGDNIIIGYLSKISIDYKSIFSNVKAMDEIDGDITNKIEIEDLDDYINHINTEGEYRFKLSVEDNSGNKIDNIFTYKLVDDTKPIIEEDEEIEEPTINEDEDIIEEKPIIEESIIVEEEKNDNEEIISSTEDVIPIIINTTIDDKLDINKIREKLIFNGIIDDNYNGEIYTEYIGNELNIGEYKINIEGIDDYDIKIIVKDSNKKEAKKEFNPTWIIIISILGVVIVIVIIIVLKKKLNKR